MDVTENDKEYQVLAELPGVKKEEISITINGNEVAVSAEVKHEKDVKNGETVLRAERYYGKIQRAFTLGQEVDEATAQAKYNDGVLELNAAEENRSGREKARGALSGASNSTNSIDRWNQCGRLNRIFRHMQLSRQYTDPASAGFLLMTGAWARAKPGIACPLIKRIL